MCCCVASRAPGGHQASLFAGRIEGRPGPVPNVLASTGATTQRRQLRSGGEFLRSPIGAWRESSVDELAGILGGTAPSPAILASLVPFFNELLDELPWWDRAWRVTT
jgi:hypothetical protein